MIPIRSVSTGAVLKLIKEMILLRYGKPNALIVDNGVQYIAKIFEKGYDPLGSRVKVYDTI